MSDYEDSFDDESTDTTTSQHSSPAPTPTAADAAATALAPPSVPLAVPIPVPVPVPVSSAGSPTADDPTVTSHEDSINSDQRSIGTDLLERALEAGIWRKAEDKEAGRPYYYNALTKERTWDLRKWLLGENSRQESEASTRRSSGIPERGQSVSTYSEATIGDGDPARFLSAQNADLNSEFNRFGRFVAFNSKSPSVARSSMAFGSPLMPTSGSDANASSKPSLVSAPFTSPKPSLARPAHEGDELHSTTSDSAAAARSKDLTVNPAATTTTATATATTAVAAGKKPEDGEDGEEHSSVDPSSVFSTLSQHLKTPPPAVTVAATPTPQTHDEAADAAPHPLPRSGAVPVLNLNSATFAPRSGDTSLMASSRAALVSPASPPALHMTLPDLPQPGLDKHRVISSPSYGQTRSLTTVPSSRVATMDDAGLQLSAPPPPLPLSGYGYAAASPYTHPSPPPPPPEDPKIVELRETSEAVERLVKAFAMLRGHAPSDNAKARATEAGSHNGGSGTVTTQDNTVTQPGARATVHVRAAAAAPLPSKAASIARTAPQAPPTAVASAQSEKLVEEVLLSYVVEMMKTEGSKQTANAQLVQRLKQRPAHETVSAESFRASDGAVTASRHRGARGNGALGDARGNVFNLFDGEMRAFSGEDSDADAALYHSVYQALHKYVLSHVVGARGQLVPAAPPSAEPCGEAQASTMSPYVAWALLLDVLTVCTDIVETFFGGGMDANGLLTQPVLVRYCGEAALEYVVRNAMHCLPFEVVAGTASDPRGGAQETYSKSVFRLEFWVTRQKLFVVMDAVRECLRHDILEEASTLPYTSFESGSAALEMVHPKALIPSPTPLLTLVESSRRGPQDSSSGPQPGRSRRAPSTRVTTTTTSTSDTGPDYFGVNPKGIESMTYTVSVLATGLLEEANKDPGPAGRPEPATAYQDFTQAVSETVCELLTDAGITAAIQRRAKDKYARLVSERESLSRNAKSDREKLIVAKAEAEAERVVRHIMQEMIARDPTSALPRNS